jgi:prepilin-type N-terminal cleavage/methylation domain-containing protein
MNMAERNRTQGFTMLELMVSMALGLLVMAAMASLFKIGMNSTILVEQRTEAQEEMRVGMDLMVKDLSLAGAGLPSGGVQLPTGAGNNGLSKFGCDQSGTCHIVNHTYPTNGASTNYMYGIIPGYENGVEGGASITAAPAPAINDSVTVIYADYNFPLSQYNAQFPSVNGTSVNLTASATPYPPLINSAGGIQQGDIIMITGGGITAVGEVTNLSANGTGGTASATGVLNFANTDPLNLNQSGAALGNLAQVAAATGVNTNVASITRLYVVTYYLSTTATAAYAGAPQTVRLMRQVNGLPPVPVADNIINLQFAYDTYNSSVTPAVLDASEANPIGVGESPNNIQKIDLVVMGQSINNWGNKSQNLYLATDVSASNMSFRNSY